MSKIEIKNLTFGYDQQEQPLFDHANLNLESTWKLGLIGRNGRGKTTLLKLLQGQLPYTGEINQQLAFVYFPQTVPDPSATTYDVIDALSPNELWQVQREMNLLKLSDDILWRPFQELSGGEQTKVLLALLFSDEDHYPLLDEPTNHLDMTGRQQVAEYLQAKQQGFIVVSHDRHFIDQTTDHILAIEKNQLELQQGNYASYQQQKNRQDNYEQQQNTKLKKDISRLQTTAREKATWSFSREKDKYGDPRIKGSGAIGDTGRIGARAARVMQKAKNLNRRMENEISSKQDLLKNIETVDPLGINFQPTFHKQLITAKNFQLSYQDQPLFAPLTWQLNQGECLALVGANGTGKTSLIKALLGQFTGETVGELELPRNSQISYLRQNYEDNHGSLTDFAEENQLDLELFLNNLHKLGMPREVFRSKIESMSMGQRKKVELAKSLATPAELYLWDEPLNYLDLYNQDQLVTLLKEQRPTMILIEHDQDFIQAVAQQTVTLHAEKQ